MKPVLSLSLKPDLQKMVKYRLISSLLNSNNGGTDMSNLRASAYLSLILSLFFLIIPFIFKIGEDVLLSAVFLAAGVFLGVLGLGLYRRNNLRKKKGRALF
jgi:hypothetical protein